jgi:hypothetical protein
MSQNWEIKGEANKTLNAEGALISAMNITAPRLTFNSQAEDTFSYFINAADARITPNFIPEFQQEISVWRDGMRQFQGLVTETQFQWTGGQVGWSVAAQGAWQEFEKVPLVTNDGTYSAPQQNLQTTIYDVLNQAVAGGARIQIGYIAPMFAVIPLEFRALSCAAALVELLRWVPDAMTSFDYAVGGFPRLNITRRTTAAVKNLTLGVDEVVQCNVSPVSNQTPDKVVITYAIANANGIVTQQSLVAGSSVALRPQILVVNEQSKFAEFQAKAVAAQQQIQTTTTFNYAYMVNADEKLKAIAGLPSPEGIAQIVAYGGSDSGNKTAIILNGSNSVIRTAPNLFVITKGEYQEWMKVLGITLAPGKLSIDLYWGFVTTSLGNAFPFPNWLFNLIAAGAINQPESVWANSTNYATGEGANGPSSGQRVVFKYRVELDLKCLNVAFPALTTLRDPGDISFTPPPSSLATDLLAAQNFVPHRGNLLLSPYQSYERDLGRCVNVSGGPASLSSMRALTQSEEIDITTGQRLLTMGQSNRSAVLSLMSKFRNVKVP